MTANQNSNSARDFTLSTAMLYARYFELVELEEGADIIFDKLDVERANMLQAGLPVPAGLAAAYSEAEKTRDALFEERTDLEETLMGLTKLDSLQLEINLEIAAKRANIFDGAGDCVRQVAAQVRAFADRRCAV